MIGINIPKLAALVCMCASAAMATPATSTSLPLPDIAQLNETLGSQPTNLTIPANTPNILCNAQGFATQTPLPPRGVFFCLVPNTQIILKLKGEFVSHPGTDMGAVLDAVSQAFRWAISADHDFEAVIPNWMLSFGDDAGPEILFERSKPDAGEPVCTYNTWLTALVGLRNFIYTFPGYSFYFEIYVDQEDQEDHFVGNGALHLATAATSQS